MMNQGIPSASTAGDTPTSGDCNWSTRYPSVAAERQRPTTVESGARPATLGRTATVQKVCRSLTQGNNRGTILSL